MTEENEAAIFAALSDLGIDKKLVQRQWEKLLLLPADVNPVLPVFISRKGLDYEFQVFLKWKFQGELLDIEGFRAILIPEMYIPKVKSAALDTGKLEELILATDWQSRNPLDSDGAINWQMEKELTGRRNSTFKEIEHISEAGWVGRELARRFQFKYLNERIDEGFALSGIQKLKYVVFDDFPFSDAKSVRVWDVMDSLAEKYHAQKAASPLSIVFNPFIFSKAVFPIPYLENEYLVNAEHQMFLQRHQDIAEDLNANVYRLGLLGFNWERLKEDLLFNLMHGYDSFTLHADNSQDWMDNTKRLYDFRFELGRNGRHDLTYVTTTQVPAFQLPDIQVGTSRLLDYDTRMNAVRWDLMSPDHIYRRFPPDSVGGFVNEYFGRDVLGVIKLVTEMESLPAGNEWVQALKFKHWVATPMEQMLVNASELRSRYGVSRSFDLGREPWFSKRQMDKLLEHAPVYKLFKEEGHYQGGWFWMNRDILDAKNNPVLERYADKETGTTKKWFDLERAIAKYSDSFFDNSYARAEVMAGLRNGDKKPLPVYMNGVRQHVWAAPNLATRDLDFFDDKGAKVVVPTLEEKARIAMNPTRAMSMGLTDKKGPKVVLKPSVKLPKRAHDKNVPQNRSNRIRR